MTEFRAKVIATVIGLAFGCLVGLGIWYLFDPGSRELDIQCGFERIPGTFTTSAHELELETVLVTVHRDDRTFMFRRDAIESCEEIENE